MRRTITRFVAQRPVTPRDLVSFAGAPGFVQAHKSTIGKPPAEVPENEIQAYVIPEVVTREEEVALLKFTSQWFERLPFADGHMDSLIHHYKEFYRPYDAMMNDDSFFDYPRESGEVAAGSSLMLEAQREHEMHLVRGALARCRKQAQDHLPFIPLQNRVHFLQLHGDGFIRAHVDENRNSSGIVAGVTIGSARVMTLTCNRFPGKKVELLLAPRSFYILCGHARHYWEHSVDWTEDDEEHIKRIQKSHVADGSEVLFDGKPSGFTRGVRSAMIFRGVSPMELLMHKMKVPHRHA